MNTHSIRQLPIRQLFLTLVLAFAGLAAQAQETSSGCAVTVRNEANGLTHITTTNAAGEYRVTNLPIGRDYTISVDSQNHGRQPPGHCGGRG